VWRLVGRAQGSSPQGATTRINCRGKCVWSACGIWAREVSCVSVSCAPTLRGRCVFLDKTRPAAPEMRRFPCGCVGYESSCSRSRLTRTLIRYQSLRHQKKSCAGVPSVRNKGFPITDSAHKLLLCCLVYVTILQEAQKTAAQRRAFRGQVVEQGQVCKLHLAAVLPTQEVGVAKEQVYAHVEVLWRVGCPAQQDVLYAQLPSRVAGLNTVAAAVLVACAVKLTGGHQAPAVRL
jgi:hypothetical protein